MQGVVEAEERELADFFYEDRGYRFATAQAYFLVKNYQQWGARIRLHSWDTWDKLGDRLGERLGQHIWHPSHWETKDVVVSSTMSLSVESLKTLEAWRRIA